MTRQMAIRPERSGVFHAATNPAGAGVAASICSSHPHWKSARSDANTPALACWSPTSRRREKRRQSTRCDTIEVYTSRVSERSRCWVAFSVSFAVSVVGAAVWFRSSASTPRSAIPTLDSPETPDKAEPPREAEQPADKPSA